MRAVKELKVFRATFRETINAWMNGATDIAFPEGSWWMVNFHRASITPLRI